VCGVRGIVTYQSCLHKTCPPFNFIFLPSQGTRYRRRGVDANGHVANYVETEMVYNVNSVMSFECTCRYIYHPVLLVYGEKIIPRLYGLFISQVLQAGRHQVSYVMVRGSVPVYWTQPGFKYRPPPVIEKGDTKLC